MPNKELKNLRTNLNKTQFPENSSRGIKAKTRSTSRNRESSNPDHLDLTISAGKSKGETVSKLKIGDRQSNNIVSKASGEEKRRADSKTFVQWMLDLYNNPGDTKEYEKNYHKNCSHMMEEVKRQLQNAIDSFSDIYNDDTTLTKKPQLMGQLI